MRMFVSRKPGWIVVIWLAAAMVVGLPVTQLDEAGG